MSSNSSRAWGAVVTLGLSGMALFFLAFIMDDARVAVVSGEGAPFPVLPLAAMLVGGGMFYALVKGPLGGAIARLFDVRDSGAEQAGLRLEQLEDRVGELSSDAIRVAELEDRLDFAERLLAQRSQLPHFESMDTPV